MSDTAPGSRPGSGLRKAGIVLMILAVVLGVGAVVAGFAPLFGDQPVEVAGGVTLEAEEGEEYALYRISGRGVEGSCDVVGPDGQDVELRPTFSTETLTLNGTSYGVDRVFTAAADGDHEVTCTSSAFAVGPRVGIFGIVGVVLLGVFGGIGLFIVGVVLLVIGLTRGRSDGPPPGQFPGQPPYPGPPPRPGQPPFGGQPPHPGQPPFGGQRAQPPWGQPPTQGPPPSQP